MSFGISDNLWSKHMNIGIFRAHLVVLQWNVKNAKNVSISENSVFAGDFCALDQIETTQLNIDIAHIWKDVFAIISHVQNIIIFYKYF